MAFSLQILSQSAEIVDFSIEDHPDGPVLVGHRLPTGLRQVDNAQPPVAETATNTALMAAIDVGIVRPPMSQEIRHPSQESFIDRRPGKIKFSADTTHRLIKNPYGRGIISKLSGQDQRGGLCRLAAKNRLAGVANRKYLECQVFMKKLQNSG